VFCGNDEQLIKEGVNSLVDKLINKNFKDLNYIKFDGNSLENFDFVINACETLPFMDEKKVVVISDAFFIQDRKSEREENGEEENEENKEGINEIDSNIKKVENIKVGSKGVFSQILDYLSKVPEYCVIIIYDVFKGKRDKPGKRLWELDKKACVVRADKIKGQQLESKIKSFFEVRNKQIGRIELKIFCDIMEGNNLSIIENEVEKLCCFVADMEIDRKNIKEVFFGNSNDDIFDLVNSIANKKMKEALDVLNELIYKGEKIPYIMNMIERQFRLLLKVKVQIEAKKNKQEIMKELNIKSEYAVEMLINQGKKFTLRQIKRAIELCLNTESRIKSSSVEQKTELELLIIGTIA
jgi:DNA polymerase-3 subunit delta